MFDENTKPKIFTDDYGLYDKYKKIKIDSIFKVGHIYHCETEEGQYLWVEPYSGKIMLAMAETHLELEDNAEIVATYTRGSKLGDKPNLQEIIKHFEWEIDENFIWDD
jgi:hypothetical protein